MKNDLSPEQMSELTDVFAKVFFNDPTYVKSEAGQREAYAHLQHRLTEFRNNVIPWLAKHMQLSGSRILEIGAGTGSSVVALAETGADVDALDIIDKHLEVARVRLDMHGLKARVVACNAVEFNYEWGDYDLILLSATMEHMTLAERLDFLRIAWQHLKPNGMIGIYETPNRLWYRDDHTSHLDFFHWLPDEMAIAYAKKSPRADFANDRLDSTTLARWGRGGSFHEVDIAVGLENCITEESLHHFMCERFESYRNQWVGSLGERYSAILGEIHPGLASAWREEMLNVLLRKK